VLFGLLHLVALSLAAALFVWLVRTDTTSSGPDDEDDSGGGGGNDRRGDRPKTSPSGGPPLPNAVQAEHRLRTEHDRFVDPARRRVRTRAPAERERPRRPVRMPG